MQGYQNSVFTANGAGLAVSPYAIIAVYIAGTVTPATIYSDNGITSLSNPFTADQFGDFQFFAPNGRYDISVLRGGVPLATVRGVLLQDLGSLINTQYGGTLTRIANFLAQTNTDMRGDSFINGLRRNVQYRRSTGLSYDDAIDVNDGDTGTETNPGGFPNTTAIAGSLEFLSRMAVVYPVTMPQVMPTIEILADYALAMQHTTPGVARFGGFGLAINDQTASSFNAGSMGSALLQAWRATKNPNYLDAAVNAATFLLVCNSPNATYQALYGETPIPDDPLNAGFAGFCDTIGTTDVISITSSSWNLVAARFLHELYLVTGTAQYETVALAVRDWMAYGPIQGFDYWAAYNPAPSAHVSTTWPGGASHHFADGFWHQLGDVVHSGTVGTDAIEYGISSLLDLGYDRTLLGAAYNKFVSLKNKDPSSPFGLKYNGRICLTGYLQLPPYGLNVAFGSLYDIQGVGTLLLAKLLLAPADFALALPLALLAIDRGSQVDQDFNTVYSHGVGFDFFTDGIIVLTQAGIGLVRCAEYLMQHGSVSQ